MTLDTILTDAFSTTILYNGTRLLDPFGYLFSKAGLDAERCAHYKHYVMTQRVGFSDLAARFAADGVALHDRSSALRTADILMQAHRKQAVLNPEYAAFHRQATEMGLRVGLISNLAMPFIGIVDNLMPDDVTRIYSCNTGMTKSKPALYGHALNTISRAPVDASRAVMVGDSYHEDYRGAQQAGLHALLYPAHNSYTQMKFMSETPDETIHDLRDIIPNLQRRGLLLP